MFRFPEAFCDVQWIPNRVEGRAFCSGFGPLTDVQSGKICGRIRSGPRKRLLKARVSRSGMSDSLLTLGSLLTCPERPQSRPPISIPRKRFQGEVPRLIQFISLLSQLTLIHTRFLVAHTAPAVSNAGNIKIKS